MDRAKFVEDSLYKIWSDMVCYHFKFLKAVFCKFYLVHSWIPWPIYHEHLTEHVKKNQNKTKQKEKQQNTNKQLNNNNNKLIRPSKQTTKQWDKAVRPKKQTNSKTKTYSTNKQKITNKQQNNRTKITN